MLQLIEKVVRTNELSREEIISLLANIDGRAKQILFKSALKTKEKYYGDKVYLRALIEFSNYCRRDCLYCGLRKSNTRAARYRLTPEEILACCQKAHELGYRTFVLQSGEDPWYTEAILVELIKRIKLTFPDAAVTLSIGERPVKEYESLFKAGADRFLMRHETASAELYRKLHPDMNQDNRQACLRALQVIGYQVGAGFMVGLPDQTIEDLADDLLYLKELEPDMAGIGPFIPHPETPLRDEAGGNVEDTLVILALTRLLLPECLLPATTALGSLDAYGREQALQVGANVVMPSLTPVKVRRLYALYPGRICLHDEPPGCRKCIVGRIRAAGFVPDFSRGDSYRYKQKSRFS